MKNLLLDLYYGRISPWEDPVVLDPEHKKLSNLLKEQEDTLLKNLTEEMRHVFKEYREAELEMQCIDEERIFIRGFRLGVRLMVEALSEE